MPHDFKPVCSGNKEFYMAGYGFGIFGLIGAAVLGVAALIFVVKITYDAIKSYLDEAKKIDKAKTAELIKTHLAAGDVRVIATVRDKNGNILGAKSWKGKELDYRLDAEFGLKNKIVYDLTV